MSPDVIEVLGPGPCEARVCQKELEGGDRNIRPDDHIRVRDKNYHRGCEPPDGNE